MSKVGFAVVGVRNFADSYIRNIKRLEQEELIKLTAVVITDQINNADKARELRNQGIKVFSSYDQLLKKGSGCVDVVGLPVSIPSHAEMAIKGMEAGYNVLLEKPPAPTVEEVDQIIKTAQKTDKFCSIGFQFIHSHTIRKLKRYILDGKLGEIKNIACKGFWPRFKSYYNRNEWAGRSICNGNVVLDGPMHNAFAHYLNNMLFLTGKEMNDSAKPKRVRAELYRAHTYIEADDTSCMEVETESGTKVYFYVTHAPKEKRDPYIEIVGTKGRAFWHFDETTKIVLNSGEEIEFDNEGINPKLEVFRIAAKKHKKDIEELYSTPDNTRNFVVAINGAYDSAKRIRSIPESYVEEFETEKGEFKTVLEDIDDIMDQAFQERKLLSDLDVEWTTRTNWFNVEDYNRFNPFS
ncbi:Gfo/Idh/MocA family oxidoreductase [Halanaerocella petrolearia]